MGDIFLISGKYEENHNKIMGSYICILCVFFMCVLLVLPIGKLTEISENPRGSVDALKETNKEYLTDIYLMYMESPYTTDVFSELFKRSETCGELR